MRVESTIPENYKIVLKYSKTKPKELPTIKNYIAENPTLYTVHIENATRPFFLIFGEQYHPKWKASINGNKIDKHIMANGFANAWYIEKKGYYDVIIEFEPQKILYVGGIISIVSFMVFSLIIINYWRHFGKDDIK